MEVPIRIAIFASLLGAASAIPASPGGQAKVSGSLSAAYHHFPARETASGREAPARGEGVLESQITVDVPAHGGLSGRITPFAKWDVAESSWDFQDGKFFGAGGGIAEFRDLYLDYRSDRLELRAGSQIVSWKSAESVSPADFLNQRDYRLDFLSPEKLGEFLVRARIPFSARSDHAVELLYLPWFTAARLPGAGHRLDPAFGTPGLSAEEDPDHHAYASSSSRRRAQAGARYLFPFPGGFEGTLFYFNGYARLPVVEMRLDEGGSPALRQSYFPAHHAGGTFQGSLGDFLLKGEMLWQDKEGDYRFRKTPLDRPARMRPYADWTVGTEYTWYGAWGADQDIAFFLEHVGSSEMRRDPRGFESFRPFTNHVFTALRYAGNGLGDRTVTLGLLSGLQRLEEVFLLEYQERIRERYRIALKAQWLTASRASPLKDLEPAGMVSGSLRFGF